MATVSALSRCSRVASSQQSVAAPRRLNATRTARPALLCRTAVKVAEVEASDSTSTKRGAWRAWRLGKRNVGAGNRAMAAIGPIPGAVALPAPPLCGSVLPHLPETCCCRHAWPPCREEGQG